MFVMLTQRVKFEFINCKVQISRDALIAMICIYIYIHTHTIYIYTYVFNFYSCFAGFNLLLICTGTKSQMCCIHYEKKYFTFLRWIYCRVRIIKVGYTEIIIIFNIEMPIKGKVLLRYFLDFCFPINQIHYNYFFFF